MVRQTNMQQRIQIEKRISEALLHLDPQSEIEGTLLARYTEWRYVGEIPTEMIGKVCAKLEAEVATRNALPGESYFDQLTGYQKWGLYQHALSLLPEEAHKAGIDIEKCMLQADFKMLLNKCVVRAAGEGLQKWKPEEPAKAKKKKQKAKKFIPPEAEEVAAYIKERGYNVDAKAFVEYYAAGEWTDSEGKPVRNWKQRVITWNNKGGMPPARSSTRGRNSVPDTKEIAPEDDVLLNMMEHVPLAERRKRMGRQQNG